MEQTQLYVNKTTWLESADTDNEKLIIDKLVHDGWYNKRQYTKLINDMVNMAESMNDPKTREIISYYMDFDNYCFELNYSDSASLRNYESPMESDRHEPKAFIDKETWLENTDLPGEKRIIRALVTTGWYNEKQYTRLIDDMKNMAKSLNDRRVYEHILYYMDFDWYCEEYQDDPELVRNYNK